MKKNFVYNRVINISSGNLEHSNVEVSKGLTLVEIFKAVEID